MGRGLTIVQIEGIRERFEKEGLTDGWLAEEINEIAQAPAGQFDPGTNEMFCHEIEGAGFTNSANLLKSLIS